jgi:hypothetical protein
MSTEVWRRESAVAEPSAALAAVEAGTDWVFFWCVGGSTHGLRATPTEMERALAAARDAVSPVEMERLAAKAERKGRTKTVVFAEMWRRADGQQMVVFHEGGPHPLPERQQPDRL